MQRQESHGPSVFATTKTGDLLAVLILKRKQYKYTPWHQKTPGHIAIKSDHRGRS